MSDWIPVPQTGRRLNVAERECLTRLSMDMVRRFRAQDLSFRQRRPLWRKVRDAIVYVLTGRT